MSVREEHRKERFNIKRDESLPSANKDGDIALISICCVESVNQCVLVLSDLLEKLTDEFTNGIVRDTVSINKLQRSDAIFPFVSDAIFATLRNFLTLNKFLSTKLKKKENMYVTTYHSCEPLFPNLPVIGSVAEWLGRRT